MMRDMASFARLVEALRPWLEDLVLVGGWAHRLHRMHERAERVSYEPLLTLDADLAFSDRMRPRGSIRDALEAARFEEKLTSDFRPPVTRYVLGEEGQVFFAEFLAPLRGDGTHRDGTPNVTLRAGGVTAQKLRYVDLLLAEPWSIRLDADVGVPLDPPATVMIANPVSFIAQKLLIRGDRKGKQAQDALYIHDTLELFRGELGALNTLWHGPVHRALHAKTAREMSALWRKQFGEVDDVLRDAARIPADRSLQPEQMQRLCALGLGAIFDHAPDR